MKSRAALLILLLIVPLIVEIVPDLIFSLTLGALGNFSASIDAFFTFRPAVSNPVVKNVSNASQEFNISSEFAENAAAVKQASNSPSGNYLTVVANDNSDAIKLIISIICSIAIIAVFQVKFKIFGRGKEKDGSLK